MTQTPPKLCREKPCPVCGYDLRAATVGGRCPECGTEIQPGRTASRIPWVHRRQLGRVRAYLATVWMVLRRPRILAAEVDRPVVLRDARKFYWFSVVLATVIGTAILVGIYIYGNNGGSGFPTPDDAAFWIVPAFVFMDRWWGILVLAVGLLLGMRAALGCHRMLVLVGIKKGMIRDRLRRLALYMSALLPMQALLLGMLAMDTKLLALNEFWIQKVWTWLVIALVVLGVSVPAVFFVPTAKIISQHGEWKMVRRLLMALLFPPVAYLLIVGILFTGFWTVGYVALAWRAMSM